MRLCPDCQYTRAYQLADGRLKCRRCGHRYRLTSAFEASRLSPAVKRRLVEMFVLGVPVYRQRFRAPASRPAIERFYRIVHATLALQEELREPFSGTLECDETTFGGARKGKRGWGAVCMILENFPSMSYRKATECSEAWRCRCWSAASKSNRRRTATASAPSIGNHASA